MKWRETGLNAFPCLMSVKWALNLSLNVLPVWPTYWRPHFLQLKTYTTLFVLQFKRPWIGIDCFTLFSCLLLISFASSFDLGQHRQKAGPNLDSTGPNLDPNFDTLALVVFMKIVKVNFEKKQQQQMATNA